MTTTMAQVVTLLHKSLMLPPIPRELLLHKHTPEISLGVIGTVPVTVPLRLGRLSKGVMENP
jgi:hypothetical protein